MCGSNSLAVALIHDGYFVYLSEVHTDKPAEELSPGGSSPIGAIGMPPSSVLTDSSSRGGPVELTAAQKLEEWSFQGPERIVAAVEYLFLCFSQAFLIYSRHFPIAFLVISCPD